MKPKEAIFELWKMDFFEKTPKTAKEIETKIRDEYGATTANISAVLNNCRKFLRKEGNGWIQRTRYVDSKKSENGLDYFVMLNIHPKVSKASKKLFLDGHYPTAIFEAFKQIEILVKEKSQIKGKFGAALMQEAFSVNTPILKVNDGLKDSDIDEQKGFMMLFTGAQIGIRDPKGHDNIEQKDPKIAIQYISFASLLCRMVDRSTKV